MTLRHLPLLAASLLLTACYEGDWGSSDRFQDDFHYSFDLQPGGRVTAETFNGSVEISGWDQNKVEISGTRYASSESLRDAVKIETHNSPSLVEVRAIKPSVTRGNSGARLLIRVPRHAVVERVTTSNGPVRVERVAGAAHLRTSNGAIRVAETAGTLDARTSNGPVEIEQFSGSLVIRTSNGGIRAERIAGGLEAETSNGPINIRLDKAPAGPVRLTSSNGHIDVAMAESPKNDLRAETSNSAITLRLPASFSARVEADTSNSRVSTEFDELDRQFPAHGDDRHRRLSANIGGGGPTIVLHTSNGNIRILKSSLN